MKGQAKVVRRVRRIAEASRIGWWQRVWQRVLYWRQLARQRRQLAMLGDAALKDLGYSRADIWVESNRPFWDDRDLPQG